MMDIKSAEWKQTTGKGIRCLGCKKDVSGSEGYVHLKRKGSNWYSPRICWVCFQNGLDDIKIKRGTPKKRDKDYNIMLKKRILKNLK
jgi:hypothetical protein